MSIINLLVILLGLVPCSSGLQLKAQNSNALRLSDAHDSWGGHAADEYRHGMNEVQHAPEVIDEILKNMNRGGQQGQSLVEKYKSAQLISADEVQTDIKALVSNLTSYAAELGKANDNDKRGLFEMTESSAQNRSAVLLERNRIHLAEAGKKVWPCKDVKPLEPFNLKAYISKKWYVQEQMPVVYQPVNELNCVYAEYKMKKGLPNGYDLSVQNHATGAKGVKDTEGYLCAQKVKKDAGELRVAPCFLAPEIAGGPYWVIAYDEKEGYAIVAGGDPYVPVKPDGDGQHWTCTYNAALINNSGLWIFTRKRAYDAALVAKVIGIAEGMGLDTSVLVKVNQEGCSN